METMEEKRRKIEENRIKTEKRVFIAKEKKPFSSYV